MSVQRPHRSHIAVRVCLAAALVAGLTITSPGVTPVSAACTVTSVVRPGDTGAAVLCLEQRLTAMGYNVGTPDTTFGTSTTIAVKDFQVRRGLYDDGVVQPYTARQLGLRGVGDPTAHPVRVSVIGDSTSAAIRWYDEANNSTARYDILGNSYDTIMSVESCRRLVVASCRGRTDPVTGVRWYPVSLLPLMQGALRNEVGEVLVVMAGYDDVTIMPAIDQIMTEARAQGVHRVLWLNYRRTNTYPNYQQYYAAHNQNLEDAKRRWPSLTVLDWNGYTAGQNSWFSSDGIHLTASGATALSQYIKNNVDALNLTSCLAANADTGTPDPTVGTPVTPPATPTGFTATALTRVYDTRNVASATTGRRVGAGRTVRVDVSAAVPPTAVSAVVSVSTVNPCLGGFVTVFPCGTRPDTSNLNAPAARSMATTAIAALTDGDVCIYSHVATHLTVDVIGAFTPEGNPFTPLSPVRWVDTRGGTVVVPISGGARTAGQQTSVAVRGVGGVPTDATAVWINLTAAAPTGTTSMVAYPGPCASAPNTTNLITFVGRATAASAIVPIGADGSICVLNRAATSHLVIDVNGYFAPSSSLYFQLDQPTRVGDSRSGAKVPAATDWPIATADVTVLNVTATEPAAFGWVSLQPCGTIAATSLLNTATGEPTANLGVGIPDANGDSCARTNIATHLVADTVGRFLPASD